MEWVHRLYAKYQNFDWAAVQQHLNRHNHHIASIPDEDGAVDIHFTHTRSPNPHAIPLILIHGWPGSFYEFDKVVDRFANPSSKGSPSFHVVVPNIPGFMWSSPPPRRGWTLQDTARLYDKLMNSLGYSSYVAQAGDWGMFIARELGAKYDGCKAVHLNFCPTPLPAELKDSDLTEREKKLNARCNDWLDNHLGYAVCMRSRPQTIGVAFADNPVGIMMWVGEKFDELAAPSHQDEQWEQDILTQVCLYYFSGCIMTSMLPYYENVKHAGFGDFVLKKQNRIKCPMGYTSFYYDSRPGTKRGVERSGNLVFYNEIDEGGHFAALECPDVLLKDCRKFFGEFYRA
jgi:pimeloyl-ACP methyl ester carboxylesterase